MALHFGNKEIENIHLGKITITSIFKGAKTIWEAALRKWKGKQIWKNNEKWKY